MSKDLQASIKSKMLTLTIGILDECDEIFGYLWGNGRPDWKTGKWIDGDPDEALSDNQKRFRDMWIDFRKYVLDSGNDAIKDVQELLLEYSIRPKKYHYEFRQKQQGDNNER